MTNPTESTGAKPIDPSTEFPEFTKDIERAVEKELVRRILEPILKSAAEKELSRYAAAPAKPTAEKSPSATPWASQLRHVMQKPQAEQTFGACRACEAKDQRIAKLEGFRVDHRRYWDNNQKEIRELRAKVADLERACEAKDRGLHLEQLARIHYAKLLDEKHFNLIEVKKECEALAAALEIKRSAHNVTRESLKGTTRKEARLEQECDALKNANECAVKDRQHARSALERMSVEHFATRVRLRDTLREAAKYARMTRDYAGQNNHLHLGAAANEDAAQFDAARAALGLDETAAPEAGERTNPVAEAIDRQMMGYAESKGEPAQQPARTPFRAGDIVSHRRSGENWVLACDEFDGYVMPAGWPDSVEPANGCDIVKPATDEERVAILKQSADSTGMRAARAKRQLEASAPEQPTPAPARRRRFLAGDRVRPAAQEIVYSAVLDEDDSGSVAIQIGSRKYLNVGASALELVKSTTQAKRNSELAFHFHLWNTSMDANVMDSVPEFVRVAAEQLLRDPFGTEYGSVLADAGAETGGAK
jgi:hypothetical protein